jgi:hypothetical protein
MSVDFWTLIVILGGQVVTAAFVVGQMGSKIDGVKEKAEEANNKIENHVDWHLSGERRHNLKL